MTEPDQSQHESQSQSETSTDSQKVKVYDYKDLYKTFMNTPLTEALNKLYEKTTYLDRYGGSLVVAVFTIIGVSLFFSYSYLKNHSDVIKNNWQQNRCNPLYIPFAGMIINPKNMSKHEYATNNFFHCFGVLLKHINILPSSLSPQLHPPAFVNEKLDECAIKCNVCTFISLLYLILRSFNLSLLLIT